MASTIHRFTVSVNSNSLNGFSDKIYEDYGFIILPENYTLDGAPTRLVISCHGAGGTVSTDDSQIEHQALTHYLVANGYAVMDVNGLPLEFSKEYGVDIRNNIGSPLAVECYLKAYEYCMEKFNLMPEVFVHGASMGGISSANLVLSRKIPVIAHSAFCPVLDTYNEIFLNPWSDGLPKTALGKLYQLDTDEDGNYIYNQEKVKDFNPIEVIKGNGYPVPVKFWHCEDDGTVSCEVTKKFIDLLKSQGINANLRTFEIGGHEPQLAGEVVDNPIGTNTLHENKIEILPAVEETFIWIKSFD